MAVAGASAAPPVNNGVGNSARAQTATLQAPRSTTEKRPSLSSSAQQLSKLFDEDVYQILLAQPAKDKTVFEKYLKDLTNSRAPEPLTTVFNQPRQSLDGKTLLELLCITGRLDHVRALYTFLGEQGFKDACSRQNPSTSPAASLVVPVSPSKLHVANADEQPKFDALPAPPSESPAVAEIPASVPSAYTIAHYAAAWGQLAILEFLSSNTAVDLLSRTSAPRSETPCDVARRNNHMHIVNLYEWLSRRQLLLFACRDAKAVLTSLEHEMKSSKAPEKREREHYDAQLSDFVETVRDDKVMKTLTVEEDIPRMAAQINTVRFAIDEFALRLRMSGAANPAAAGRGSTGEGMLGVAGGAHGRSASTTKGVRGSSVGGGAAKSKKNKK